MTTLKPTVCQICGCNCGLLVTLDKGRVTHVQGDPDVPQNRGGICIKGKMSPRVLYASDRLKQPMIRRKYGTGFVSASWSDALSEIATQLEKERKITGRKPWPYTGDDPLDSSTGHLFRHSPRCSERRMPSASGRSAWVPN